MQTLKVMNEPVLSVVLEAVVDDPGPAVEEIPVELQLLLIELVQFFKLLYELTKTMKGTNDEYSLVSVS